MLVCIYLFNSFPLATLESSVSHIMFRSNSVSNSKITFFTLSH